MEQLNRHRPIQLTAHSLSHLFQAKRDFFKANDLLELLNSQTPVLVGLQRNGCFACFYSLNGHFIRVILDLSGDFGIIVTFYIVDKLPVIL